MRVDKAEKMRCDICGKEEIVIGKTPGDCGWGMVGISRPVRVTTFGAEKIEHRIRQYDACPNCMRTANAVWSECNTRLAAWIDAMKEGADALD